MQFTVITIFSILFCRNPYFLLVLVCCVTYWPSIWGQLVFDDRPAIIENKDLRSHTPLYRLFQNDYWGTPLYKVFDGTFSFYFCWIIHQIKLTHLHHLNNNPLMFWKVLFENSFEKNYFQNFIFKDIYSQMVFVKKFYSFFDSYNGCYWKWY